MIDRDSLKHQIIETYEYEFPTASGAFDEFVTKIIPNIINNAPTIDAMPVVRCRECKHWYEYSCNEEYGSCHFWQANDNENTETESDDFCSYGQRKDGAE